MTWYLQGWSFPQVTWDASQDYGRIEWKRTLSSLEKAPDVAYQGVMNELSSTWGVKGLVMAYSNLAVTWKVRPQMCIVSWFRHGLHWLSHGGCILVPFPCTLWPYPFESWKIHQIVLDSINCVSVEIISSLVQYNWYERTTKSIKLGVNGGCLLLITATCGHVDMWTRNGFMEHGYGTSIGCYKFNTNRLLDRCTLMSLCDWGGGCQWPWGKGLCPTL